MKTKGIVVWDKTGHVGIGKFEVGKEYQESRRWKKKRSGKERKKNKICYMYLKKLKTNTELFKTKFYSPE